MNDATEQAAQAIAMRNLKMRMLLMRLINPDDLGHAVSEEVRRLISQTLIEMRGET